MEKQTVEIPGESSGNIYQYLKSLEIPLKDINYRQEIDVDGSVTVVTWWIDD